MKFISYSHICDGVPIWCALQHVELGFYVDVRAAGPTFHDVTRAFYDRGWRGINIEPNPCLWKALNHERPRDINLCLAVSRTPDEPAVSLMSSDRHSTVVDELASRHPSDGDKLFSVHVPVTTLSDICNEHVGHDQSIHFLKIDAEGSAADVLSGNDWTRFRPWIVLVVAIEPSSQCENHKAWEETLLDAGYEWVFTDRLSRCYVAMEQRKVAAECRYPPELLHQVVRAVEFRDEIVALEEEIARLKEKHALELRRQEISFLRNESALVLKLKQAGIGLNDPSTKDKRSALGRLLFRRNGRPRKPLRFLLFASSGKPRKITRRALFRRNGTPRKPFISWMRSHDYQRLPRAHRF